MAEQLISFGIWRSLHEPLLPDPAWFIDEQWSPMEKQQVLAYLGQGRRLNYRMGFSWCRFRCGIDEGIIMGTCDLTDGAYCWPEGLTHYVENHQVRVPHEIVNHILAQFNFPFINAKRVSETTSIDTTWWQQQRGWNYESNSFLSGHDQEEKDYLRRFDRKQIEFNDTTDMALEAVAAREKMIQSLQAKFAT